MKLGRSVLMVGILLTPAMATANDFGILKTAVPVEKSVWRLGGGGIVSLEDGGREAVVVSGTTGIAPKADVEAKWSISGDDMAFGGALNYQVLSAIDNKPIDVSVNAGFHYVNHDVNDITSVDIAAIASKEIKPKFSVYGAIDLAFLNFDEGGSETGFNIVPGVSYKLSDKASIVGELGLGISNYATTYIAAMFQYYIR